MHGLEGQVDRKEGGGWRIGYMRVSGFTMDAQSK